MKKFVFSAILTMTILIAPFIKIQDAKAATLIEYALLQSLITKILAGSPASGTGSSSGYDMSKVQYCAAANNSCALAESELNNAKLNGQIFQAAGIKCIYEFYFKNKRFPNTEELTASCGTEVSITISSNAIITAANTIRTKACEMKTLACKDFPEILNPIQQQFQTIAQQI